MVLKDDHHKQDDVTEARRCNRTKTTGRRGERVLPNEVRRGKRVLPNEVTEAV